MFSEHRKKTFCEVISFLSPILVFPKQSTESFIQSRSRRKCVLYILNWPKTFTELITDFLCVSLSLEHLNRSGRANILFENSRHLYPHPRVSFFRYFQEEPHRRFRSFQKLAE